MGETKRDKLISYIEEWSPLFFSALVTFLFVINPIIILDDIDNALNAIISLTSILLGFTGVLVTLMFGMLETRVMKTIFDESFSFKKRLKRYFSLNCCSGFILLFLSVLLFFRETLKNICINIVWAFTKYAFVFFLLYFIFSSFRIIYITIQLLFLPMNADTDNNEADQEDYTDLRERYK